MRLKLKNKFNFIQIIFLCSLLAPGGLGNALAEIQIERYPDGKVKFEIEVDEVGLPHGVVRQFDPEGNLKSEKHYEHGLLEGLSRLFYKSGQVMTEWLYNNGKRDGIALGYFPDGKLKDRGVYKDDKLNGPVRKYYRDGTLKSEMIFEDDRLEGVGKTFDDQGQLEFQYTYRRGVLVNRKTFNKEGEVVLDQDYSPPPVLP